MEAQHDPVCVFCGASHEREVISDDGDLLHQLGLLPEVVVVIVVEQTGGEQEEAEVEQQDLLVPSH